MDAPNEDVSRLYGNRLRLRVCGLCRDGDRLLMVRHRNIGPANTFWSPPGGGVEFGEMAPDALIREFAEETGLTVTIGDLLFVNEVRAAPLHAIELFFMAQVEHGLLRRGIDPEMSLSNQLIDDVRFMRFEEIKALPAEEVHSLFRQCNSMDDVFKLKGYLH